MLISPVSISRCPLKILLVPAEAIDPLNQLSANTLRRCEAALEVWRTGQFDRILVTGGMFLDQKRQTIPAATIMWDWFTKHGVRDNQILVEPGSLDTYQNIDFGLRLLREEGCADAQITVITQYQHALRFAITFFLAHQRRINLIMIRQPAMLWKEWLMEWLVIIPYHLIDWRGTLWLARHNRAQRAAAAQT